MVLVEVNRNSEDKNMKEFLESLASKEPTPGGGGASALVAAVSCALCSMVANLTTGKKKYAQYQEQIEKYIDILEDKREVLQADIKKDADAFAPLAAAYSLDKATPNYDEIMENATYEAAKAPLEILEDIYSLVPIIEDLSVMGSRLAISDVAVAAVCCKAALQGCSLNIFINTKSMKNREVATKFNERAFFILKDAEIKLDTVYAQIQQGLIS